MQRQPCARLPVGWRCDGPAAILYGRQTHLPSVRCGISQSASPPGRAGARPAPSACSGRPPRAREAPKAKNYIVELGTLHIMHNDKLRRRALDNPQFKVSGRNPLTELSEVRFEIEDQEGVFDLTCRLRFGKMQYEYKEQEYEVGVSKAYLRLALEGCETTLGSGFGENPLAAVFEEDCVDSQSSVGIGGSLGGDIKSGASAEAAAGGGASTARKRMRTQSLTHLPVKALPNDSWEVIPQTVSGQLDTVIEGTAIPSARLCSLRRKTGGNRLAIVGEVQVSRSAVKVSSRRGNRLGKSMSEWKNKDAIVSLILRNALQREASSSISQGASSAVAISRCEVLEE